MVAAARAAFESGKTRPLAWRKQQISAVIRMLEENRDAICKALYADLHRPPPEAVLGDIIVPLNDARYHLKHIESWAARRHVPTPSNLLPGTSYLQPEPRGVVLVVGPWNFREAAEEPRGVRSQLPRFHPPTCSHSADDPAHCR